MNDASGGGDVEEHDEDAIVGDAYAYEVDDYAGPGPPNRPPLNKRKVALLVAVAVALCAGGYLIVNATSSPSPGSQLQTAWQTVSAATKGTVTNTGDAARAAAAWNGFAVAVGRIAFSGADEGQAHSVIRDAIALAADTRAIGFSPATPAQPGTPDSACPDTTIPLGGVCIPLPGRPAWPARPATVAYPANFQPDVTALNRDVQTLFAELGMKEPD